MIKLTLQSTERPTRKSHRLVPVRGAVTCVLSSDIAQDWIQLVYWKKCWNLTNEFLPSYLSYEFSVSLGCLFLFHWPAFAWSCCWGICPCCARFVCLRDPLEICLCGGYSVITPPSKVFLFQQKNFGWTECFLIILISVLIGGVVLCAYCSRNFAQRNSGPEKSHFSLAINN